MSTARGTAAAFSAIFERDLRIFLSYRMRALAQLSGLVLTLTIFHYVAQLVDVGKFGTPNEYFAFVATGLLAGYILQSALFLPAQVQRELLTGTFERLVASPLGPVQAIMAVLLFPIVFACLVAIVGFVLAALIFDLPVHWSTAPAALPVALLGALAFSALGILMVACVIVFKQSPGIGLVLALISLTGGMYFPVELLPGWLAWLSEVQPFTPTVDLLRHLLIGTEAAAEIGPTLAKLVGFVIVLVPLSVVVLRAAVRSGRRRGTLLEY